MVLSHGLELAVKSTLLLALAMLVTLALRRRPATLRHLVWALSLLGTLALPALEASLPRVVIATPIAGHSDIQAADPVRSPAKESPVPIDLAIPAPSKPVHLSVPGIQAIPPRASAAGISLSSLALWIWLAVACALALYRFSHLLLIQRVERKALRGAVAIVGRLTRRRVELAVSCEDVPAVPLTWGLFHPVVLLPKSSESWASIETETVLAHELAHARRCDSLWQEIAFLACALYWFNPAIWLAARAMRVEAEHAADDSVLSSGVSPSDYASVLVILAAAASGRRLHIPPAGVAFMNSNKLERRIDAILDPHRPRRAGAKIVSLIAPLAATAVCLLAVCGFRAAGMPPGAKGDKAAFIPPHSGSESDSSRETPVFYKGNMIGVVRLSVRKEAQARGWHWPDAGTSAAPGRPTGYWKVEFPSPDLPTTYIVHTVGNIVQMTSLAASWTPQQPVNGRTLEVDGLKRIVLKWQLELQSYSWPDGGSIRVNGATLYPRYLDDPKYRARIKPAGFRVDPISKAEAEEFSRVRFSPSLERALAEVENDVIEEQARSENRVLVHWPRDAAAHQERKVDAFDSQRSKELMLAADRELQGLAKDWANASIAVHREEVRARNAGSPALYDAKDRLQLVREKINKITMSYGMPPNSGPIGMPDEVVPFFKEQAEKLKTNVAALDRKSDEGDALFKKRKISEYDKELAEDLAAIETYKARSIEQRIRFKS